MLTESPIRRLDAKAPGLAEELKRDLDIDITRCLECGKCSGGCSYAHGFDYTPRKMVQLIKLEERGKLLRMRALWTCLSCQLCLDRCPSSIDMPRILDYLRGKAYAERLNDVHPEIEKFYEIMLSDIRNNGRISETLMMARFNFATRRYFSNADLGMKLFFKGKLKLFGPKTKNLNSLRALFAKLLFRSPAEQEPS